MVAASGQIEGMHSSPHQQSSRVYMFQVVHVRSVSADVVCQECSSVTSLCLPFPFPIACVASVSVWFRSKERPRSGILGFGHARNETRAKKVKVGSGGREGRKRLQTNPSILKTCVRQRTQRLIGSASRTMLTCVNQRFV